MKCALCVCEELWKLHVMKNFNWKRSLTQEHWFYCTSVLLSHNINVDCYFGFIALQYYCHKNILLSYCIMININCDFRFIALQFELLLYSSNVDRDFSITIFGFIVVQ